MTRQQRFERLVEAYQKIGRSRASEESDAAFDRAAHRLASYVAMSEPYITVASDKKPRSR